MTVFQLTGVLMCLAASVVTESTDVKTKLHWQKHYDSAKEVAQAKARPLVVVLENPSRKSEKIDESKLQEKNRKTLAKERFELVRVDVNTDYGKKVAEAFGATKFPFTAVTDKKSRHIVYRKQGQMTSTDWTFALAKSKTEPKVHVANKVVVKSSPSVLWQTHFETAQHEASQNNKPLFVFLTAPGCTYCELLKREALQQQWIIDDLNNNFVAVQVNGRERKDIADRFGVRMFPMLLVMNSNGEVVEQWSGFNGTSDFANHIANAKSKTQVTTAVSVSYVQ